MTIGEAQQRLLFRLYHVYDNHEAANIADWVMEHVTGWKRIDRLLNKSARMSKPMIDRLEKYADELADHRPVQYVLGEAFFCGMKFYVDENVLIPRPETEELVDWISSEINPHRISSALDIGTGSGCIAVALKKKNPSLKVYACDLSEGALRVAKKNSEENNASLSFITTDLLNEEERKQLPATDLIVSNPPYIPAEERLQMNRNVTAYEPPLALFVDDHDPLVFYRIIANMHSRFIYVEIHENFGRETAALFESAGYRTTIKKDMQGKERMIRAVLI